MPRKKVVRGGCPEPSPTDKQPTRFYHGYIRVSTDEQARSGLGLMAQGHRITAYCDARDLHLHTIWIDSESAKRGVRRPGLDGLTAAITGATCHGVVVLCLDRLLRSLSHLLELMDLFHAFRVDFHSVQEGVDTATPGGRLQMNLRASIAQWEREQIGLRTQMALAQLRAAGRYCGGRPPYGLVRSDENRLVPNQAERDILAGLAARWCEGYSSGDVARLLNRRGWFSRTGRWSASAVLYHVHRLELTDAQGAGRRHGRAVVLEALAELDRRYGIAPASDGS